MWTIFLNLCNLESVSSLRKHYTTYFEIVMVPIWNPDSFGADKVFPNQTVSFVTNFDPCCGICVLYIDEINEKLVEIEVLDFSL